MKLKHIYILFTMLLLLVGCSDEPLGQGNGDAPQMELIPLHFSVTDFDVAETRGTTADMEGTLSEVGVFLMSESEYEALLAGELTYDGNATLGLDSMPVSHPYFHNIENLEPYNVDRNNVHFKVSDDNVLAPVLDSLQLFYSTTGGTVVFAYAPYKEGMTKEMLFQPESVTVPGNQSTDSLVKKHDFYLATPVMRGSFTGNPVNWYHKYITLEFRHQYARLVLASNDKSLQNMCWNLTEGTEADRVAVFVKDVPTKGTWKLNSEGTDFDFEKTDTGRIFMASYDLLNGQMPDTITSTALVLPEPKGAAPRFGIVFYRGDEELKTVPLSVRGGGKNITLERAKSKTFNCNYGEEDKLRDAFTRGLNYTLTEDVTLSESLILAEGDSMTLNLNGHTISMENECKASFEMIKNMGTLTIVDEHMAEATRSKVRGGANEGAGKVGRISFKDIGAGDSNFGWGTYTISNYGTLTVNGGVIENISEQNPLSGQVVHMYCAIQQSAGSTIVNGGRVSNPTYRSIRINKGALIVNGGVMEGQVWLQPNQGNVTIEVSGGEFSPRGVDASSIFMENNGKNYTVTSAKISGGTFQTKIGCSIADKTGVKGCIIGGTFTETAMQNTNKNLFAEETYLVKIDEGNYIVKHSTDETQDLLTAFRNGGEYQLEEDVILIHPLTLAKGKALVLDLNGHSITHEMKCTVSYNMITNSGDLTIKGAGEISFTDTSAGGGDIWGSYTIYNYGTLDVSDATIVHYGSTGDWGTNRPTNIPIDNHMGKVTVNSGTISSKMFRSLRDFTAGGEIVINGGKFEGQIWMQGEGTGSSSLTINGGEFEPLKGYDGSSVYLTNGTNDIEFSVTGGTFNTKIGVADASKAGVKGRVKGGRFTETAMQNTNKALFAEGYRFEKKGEYYVLVEGPSILENLQKAFNTGGEYVLEGDVVLPSALTLAKGKTLVLDLNGYSISHEMECTASYNMITNNGDLTIKGEGKISFTDTGVADPSFGRGSYTINNKGTLVVNGGLIENLSEQNKNNVVHMYCAIQQSSGTTTVNGGVVSNPTYRSIRINNGALIVNGGTMEGQVWLQPNQGNVTIEVSGGEFSPSGVDGSSIFMTNAGESNTVSSAEITGGKFYTKIGASSPSEGAVKGCIKGGLFTQTAKDYTNAALIAEGHIFVDNGNGTYTLQEKKESVGRGEGVADNTLEALSRTR